MISQKIISQRIWALKYFIYCCMKQAVDVNTKKEQYDLLVLLV